MLEKTLSFTLEDVPSQTRQLLHMILLVPNLPAMVTTITSEPPLGPPLKKGSRWNRHTINAAFDSFHAAPGRLRHYSPILTHIGFGSKLSHFNECDTDYRNGQFGIEETML